MNEGTSVFTGTTGFVGNTSHRGIFTTSSDPGTLLIPVEVRVFPLKGHEITGWYVYRGMVNTNLLERAFAPALAGRGIDKAQVHEFGGFWMWTLKPYFDIHLSGNIAFLGSGDKDIMRLADCNLQVAGVQACDGKNAALVATECS